MVGKNNNCGVLSRDKNSIFMWDDDTEQKIIVQSPDCSIPLILVSEDDKKIVLFNSVHSSQFRHGDPLMPDGILISPDPGANNVDQQSIEILSQGFTDSIIPIGSTVCHSNSKCRLIDIVTNNAPPTNGGHSYIIFPLNRK